MEKLWFDDYIVVFICVILEWDGDERGEVYTFFVFCAPPGVYLRRIMAVTEFLTQACLRERGRERAFYGAAFNFESFTICASKE